MTHTHIYIGSSCSSLSSHFFSFFLLVATPTIITVYKIIKVGGGGIYDSYEQRKYKDDAVYYELGNRLEWT